MNTTRDEEIMHPPHSVRHFRILVIACCFSAICTAIVWIWGTLVGGFEVDLPFVFLTVFLFGAVFNWFREHARIVIQDIDEHRGA
jgi:hypothetical protein